MPNQFLSPEGDLENYFITESWLIDQWVGDTLWTWGRNYNGVLGNNGAADGGTPLTTSAGGTNWKQVAAGPTRHTAAIKTDGTLWTWGQNSNGALGDNTTTNRLTPVTTFAGGTNWKQVACGRNFTAAIKTDGTLWTWGQNGNGYLGDNTSTNRSTPVTTFAGGTNWKQVAGGLTHTAAIKTDGTLWTWGRNLSGQVGNNDTSGFTNYFTPVTTFAGGTNWKQVACGNAHTSAIKTDGTLWTWGQNSYGQLGDNTTTQRYTPVTTFAGGTNWKQVAGAPKNTMAIKTDGTLWTWGWGVYLLGINQSGASNRLTPVTTFVGGTNWKQVAGSGYDHTAAIKTDGTLWTWGSNNRGQMGDNNASVSRSIPSTTFAGGTNWKQVACGYEYTIAVTSGTDPTFFIS